MLLNAPRPSRTSSKGKLFFPLLILAIAAVLAGSIRFERKTVADETPVETKSIPYGPEAPKLPNNMTNRKIIELLEEPFTCENSDEITLNKAIEQIRDKTKINVYIDQPALNKIGVTEESPVQLRLPFILPLREVLDYLVKQHPGMAWEIKDEMLRITTREQKDKYYHETYYVGDLLFVPITAEKLVPDSPEAKKTGENFKSLVNYIKTMVAPETWEKGEGEILEYFPNLSLVIRQREEQHAQIIELLQRLRKYQGVQICFEIEALTNNDWARPNPYGTPNNQLKMTCFNGKDFTFTTPWKGDHYVRLSPRSGTGKPGETTPLKGDENKPFFFRLPEGKSITFLGVVGKKDGRDTIRVTMTVEGEKPETRLFYASPIKQEEEEYQTGVRPAVRSSYSNDKMVSRIYMVADLLNKKGGGKNELIELVRSVVSPDSWNQGGKLSFNVKNELVVVNTLEVHAEIGEMFQQLRKLNDLQVEFLVESVPFDAIPKDEQGNVKWASQKIVAFNGQSQTVVLSNEKHLVRVQPISSEPVSSDEAAKNEPIHLVVPAGKTLQIQGVVSQDRKNIRVAATVDGTEQQTRLFYARPIVSSK